MAARKSRVSKEMETSDNELKLHYELVNYMRTLDGDQTPPPICQEHSYSAPRHNCGRGGIGCQGDPLTGTQLRPLCTRRAPRCKYCRDDSEPTILDVTGVDEHPELPGRDSDSEDDEYASDGDMDERLKSSAPTAAHASLACKVLAVLEDARLQTLAGRGVRGAEGRKGAELLAARRLRRLLALQPREGGWLLAALGNRGAREIAALRASAPALVSRLCSQAITPPPIMPVSPAPRPRHSRPTLLWLPSGDPREDTRWENSFRPLFPVKRIPDPIMERCSVERWCAEVLERARAEVRAASAGSGSTVVCGAGAGAALALQLPHLLPVLALGAPRVTAEGGWRAGPAGSAEGRSLQVRGGRAGGDWCGGRVLVVGGAGEDLRVSPRSALLSRRPQRAIDALIVDECERWLLETAASTEIEQKKTHLEVAEMEPPGAHDILRMPIVFADDEPDEPGKAEASPSMRGRRPQGSVYYVSMCDRRRSAFATSTK